MCNALHDDGGPPHAPARPMNALSRNEAATLRMLAECFLPLDASALPDAVDAEVVPFMDAWLGRLKPLEALRIRGLLRMFEHYYAVEKMDPTARFSKASREDQIAYLSGWEHSAMYARRLAFQGIRSMVTIAYDQHEKVRESQGRVDTAAVRAERAERFAAAAAMLEAEGDPVAVARASEEKSSRASSPPAAEPDPEEARA